MKYFIDTEFLEGTQKKLFGNTKPTIDLISIALVAEDNREYYAISKDFNLKEAWNRYDKVVNKQYPLGPEYNKVYWIRDNVLKPIWEELKVKEYGGCITRHFTYNNFKWLIKEYGKTNKQIAKEIQHFVANRPIDANKEQWILDYDTKDVKFYGYYCDYDWVTFCWLFGKMIDLPNGFPIYCVDLKQELDKKVNSLNWLYCRDIWSNSNRNIKTIGKGQQQEKDRDATFEEKIKIIKELAEYPKQTNEHNALADAKWNFELYKFLNTL